MTDNMKKSLLIKDVLHRDCKCNILIEDCRFKAIGVPADTEAEQVINADGKAILPAFYNTHTHAAMTLLRGYADDMPLQKWLNEYIWPFEAKMTADDMVRGTEMAVDEMIKTGTVGYYDMYFNSEKTACAARKAGMRAIVSECFFQHTVGNVPAFAEITRQWNSESDGMVRLAIAPHAIYTNTTESLKTIVKTARDNGALINIHLSETKAEVDNCIRQYGMTPVRYLDSIGLLGPDVMAAHCVWVDREEWDILAERGVTVSHNPCSNMKLGSGIFPYRDAIASGVRITLGTDGCSSNNNLDMREEMKFAALLSKVNGDVECLPAKEIMRWATVNGAEAFGLDAGIIAEGKLADCLLVDLNDHRMKPCHNLVSNWVYAASSDCITTVICNGSILFSK